MKLRLFLVAAGWAWAGVIVWLSLTPSPPDPGIDQGDKVGHLLGYGILMGWFAFLYKPFKSRLAYAIAFAAMGIALEFAQGALGYRTLDPLDMLANSLGVCLGWIVASRIWRDALPHHAGR